MYPIPRFSGESATKSYLNLFLRSSANKTSFTVPHTVMEYCTLITSALNQEIFASDIILYLVRLYEGVNCWLTTYMLCVIAVAVQNQYNLQRHERISRHKKKSSSL